MIGSRIARRVWTSFLRVGCASLVRGMWDSIRKLLFPCRVPIITQMSRLECGAACLAVILNFHGRKTRISECRECLGVGTDGVTAHIIAKEARRFGLRVRAYSVSLNDFKYLPLPAIAHWNFNHFVVVERWSPKRVVIVDPAVGRRKLTAAEFDEGFTGAVLTFEPGVQFEKRGATGSPLWPQFLKGLLQVPGTPGVLMQIFGASIILQALGLSMPLFTKVVVDQVLPRQITDIMGILAVGMLTLILAQMAATYLRSALLMRLKERLDPQMMLNFFEHVFTLPYQFFQTRSIGDLLMRLRSNSTIREVLTVQTTAAVLDSMLIIGYLGILLTIQPVFGFIALALGTAQILLLLVTTPKMREVMRHDLAAQSASQSYIVEALSGIATLKASGTEDRALNRWSNLYFKELGISLQRDHLAVLIEAAQAVLRTLSPLVLLWVGAMFVLNGQMSLGTMLAINVLAISFLTPLASLVRSGQTLPLVASHLERIGDVLEAEPEQDLRSVRNAPRLSGSIELKNVHFRYSADSVIVLHSISLSIEPGQKVALVGPTGSGKSTLAKICMGLYPSTNGEVFYDGLPLQSLRYQSIRSQFGVVMQDPFLFSGSVRENIAFNDPTLPMEAIVRAAKLAAIHDEITQMPMEYETMVGEGGARLSGGQLQRIALARALANKPVILILDEATSHLDAVTEGLVDYNLSQLSCTRIVIAHRLSTVRNADLICVLKEGRIVERGTHPDLLALKGLYAELVHSQLEDDTDNSPNSPGLTALAGSSNGHRSSQALLPGSRELVQISDKGGRDGFTDLDTAAQQKKSGGPGMAHPI
jgi:ATP-binding cassette, subfamily B, bacterial